MGRVLQIIDNLVENSGVAQVVMNIVRHSGFPMDIAFYGQCSAALKGELETHRGLAIKLPPPGAFSMRQYGLAIRNVYNQNNYLAAHCHLLNSAVISLGEAARAGVQSRIIQAHNPVSGDTFLKKLRNDFLVLGIPRFANYYLAVSNVSTKLFGKHANEADIIPNGISTERFEFNAQTRSKMRYELNLDDEQLCVGMVGRFAPQKNHRFMLRVFKQLAAERDAILLMVGDGALKTEIVRYAKSLGLSEKVLFVQHTDNISAYYQAMDVFAMPSLFEGFGIAAVEAQCTGLPCVLSEHIPKDTDCGNASYVPLNVRIWAERIMDIANKRCTKGSQDVVNKGMDIKTMGNRYKTFYESVFGGKF